MNNIIKTIETIETLFGWSVLEKHKCLLSKNLLFFLLCMAIVENEQYGKTCQTNRLADIF